MARLSSARSFPLAGLNPRRRWTQVVHSACPRGAHPGSIQIRLEGSVRFAPRVIQAKETLATWATSCAVGHQLAVYRPGATPRPAHPHPTWHLPGRCGTASVQHPHPEPALGRHQSPRPIQAARPRRASVDRRSAAASAWTVSRAIGLYRICCGAIFRAVTSAPRAARRSPYSNWPRARSM